ncbi:glycosyltransferase [Enterococcus casseliflavus]|uniref:glycosyltransferase n=3 Tax=Enterococcus casseliflavus TaxID=37734 RepID=UPI0022E994FE|nr:glycosyltransferase [Enterococcus casseliflavus]
MRSGGLTKYVVDLVNEQKKTNDVVLLYPGNFRILSKEIKIIHRKSDNNCDFFELYNSLPLAFSGGIKNPTAFMKHVEKKIYSKFLREINPDIIHIHTLMGIHKEFFVAAKELGIKIVFTSHDYFGLSPVPNFYNEIGNYDFSNKNSEIEWIKASQNANSACVLRVYQMSFYPFIKKLKKYLVRNTNNNNNVETEQKEISLGLRKKVVSLMLFYQEVLSMVDMFHFNSTISRDVYLANLSSEINYKILPISNSDIVINDFQSNKNKEIKKIGYIGQYTVAKGVYKLIEDLWEISKSTDLEFTLHLFGDSKDIIYKNDLKVKNHGKFKKEEIAKVYKEFDVIIVPSLWKETFSLVVAEAISFNKRILVSSNVGAKDLLCSNQIYDHDDFQSFKNKLLNLSQEENHVYLFKDHVNEIYSLYNDIL